jgi:Domain of unknown function (DUF3806)
MDDTFRPPSEDELAWLRQAEERINDFLYEYYFDEEGEGRLDHSEADLGKAQEVLENEGFGPEQELELVSLGAVLGNVFAANTPMRWAVVTNEFGTNLGLRHPETGFVLYPLWMIVKRVEQGRAVDIPALYWSFVRDLGLAPGGSDRA